MQSDWLSLVQFCLQITPFFSLNRIFFAVIIGAFITKTQQPIRFQESLPVNNLNCWKIKNNFCNFNKPA